MGGGTRPYLYFQTGEFNMARFDKTNAEVFIGVQHHRIHNEQAFIFSDTGANVQAATPKLWQVITPNGSILAHANFVAGANDNCLVEMFEAPTKTGEGTAISSNNLNRNSSNVSALVIKKDPTISVAGTLLLNQYNPAGSFNLNGLATPDLEIILKKNTVYLFRFTVATNGTNVYLNGLWYEIDTSVVGV